MGSAPECSNRETVWHPHPAYSHSTLENYAWYVVSLSQFRDNVNVAAKRPTASFEMAAVCSVLIRAWNLLVVCDCSVSDAVFAMDSA